MKTQSPFSGKLMAVFFLLFMAIPGYSQNPSTKVFEDWSTVSSTQNSFQRSMVRSRSFGSSTFYYLTGGTLNSSGKYEVITQKMDANGAVLWTQTYSGTGAGHSVGTDIRIDAVGNVYVCGGTYKDTTDSTNALILKYNSGGTFKWAYSYNGPGSKNDGFLSMYVNGNAVAAVGTAWGGSTPEYDFLAVRLDSSGNNVWTRTWDYVGLNDGAHNLYFSGTSLYVAGGAQSASTTYEYAVVRLKASDGTVQGTTITGGSGFGIDQLTDIQTDATGNVYVTGGVYNGLTTLYDFKTLKYDTALTLVWSKVWNGADSLDDVATGLYLDQNGSVIVTGYTNTTTQGKNFATVKYSSGGVQQWASTFNGSAGGNDSASCIVVSSTDTNKIYVSGYSYNGSSKDYWTVRYNGGGTAVWNIGYNNLRDGDDRAFAIALDTVQNIIVTGQNKLNDSTYTYTTVRYVEESVTLPDDTISATSSSFVFTENKGQLLGTDTLTHPEVRFYTLHGSPNVCFTDTSVSYIIAKLDTSASNNDSIVRVDMKFNSSNSGQRIRAMDVRPEYSSFFLGHIPEGRSRVQNYNQLVSFNIYNNVDVIYGSNERGLKSYFICKPGGGGNPATAIKLGFTGADSIRIDGSGQLIIYTPLGSIRQPKAAAWQIDANGDFSSLGWQPSYSISGTEVSFTSFGTYNSSLTLVLAIDWGNPSSVVCPTGVTWSTFIGGGSGLDEYRGMKINASGVYVCGATSCANFPAVTALSAQNFLAGGLDAIVSKFFHDGPIHWSCYYGGNTDLLGNGNSTDEAYGIDVDPSGSVYIVGLTNSDDFPLITWTGAYNQSSYTCTGSGCSASDQFIVKLNSQGTNCSWATYYGGDEVDVATDIEINPTTGAIFMVGYGGSNFPLLTFTGGYNSTGGTGTLVKFNSSGVRQWATKIGGTNNGGRIDGIAIDPNGDIVIAGNVGSGAGFPIQFAGGNSTFGGGTSDGYVTKFFNSTNALAWSTYYGGNGDDACSDVIYVQEGTTIYYYVIGQTYSPTSNPIPLVNPGFGAYYQSSFGGGSDGFVAQFHSAGGTGSLVWSTYYGGSGLDLPQAITADSDDNLFITGYTYSNDLPMPATNLSNAYVNTTLNWQTDAFIAAFQKVFHNYLWGTYFGGGWSDKGYAIGCDGNTKLYLAGQVGCMPDFPLCQGTPNANGTPYYDDQSTPGIGVKAFISDLDLTPVVVVGIPDNTSTEMNLSVYPSPANNTLWIAGDINTEGDVTIGIVDMLGQIVYRQTAPSSRMLNKQVDISTFADGVYVVHVETKNSSFVRKFVVQR